MWRYRTPRSRTHSYTDAWTIANWPVLRSQPLKRRGMYKGFLSSWQPLLLPPLQQPQKDSNLICKVGSNLVL